MEEKRETEFQKREEDSAQSSETSVTDPENVKGLTTEEAKVRLKEYGYNEIKEKEESWWHRLFRRFWGPIPWMIEAAAILPVIVFRVPGPGAVTIPQALRIEHVT